MKLFFRMLIAAIILNIFVHLYTNSSRPDARPAGGGKLAQSLEQVKKEHIALFNSASAVAIKGTKIRIKQIRNEFGVNLQGLRITPKLLAVAQASRSMAQNHLDIIQSFRDTWLNDLRPVKADLTKLLEIELGIWDSILGLANLKHGTVSFDRQLNLFVVQSAQLADTLQKVSAELRT